MSRCVVHLAPGRVWINGTEITNISQFHLNVEAGYGNNRGVIDLTILPDEIVYGPLPEPETNDLYDPALDTKATVTEPKPPRGLPRA